VAQLVVISTSTVYGAAPENPLYMREDEPLSASRGYPEIRDRVEVDALASAFVWRVAEVRTACCGPCTCPARTDRGADHLRRRARRPCRPDPLMQVIHEDS
jgi:UDP-glucose 4-epimerase